MEMCEILIRMCIKNERNVNSARLIESLQMKTKNLKFLFIPNLKYRVFQINIVLINIYHFFILKRCFDARDVRFIRKKQTAHKFVDHNFVYRYDNRLKFLVFQVITHKNNTYFSALS